MVKRGHDPQAGLWSLPGGRVELGETLATALEREVLEETGLAVRCGGFAGFAEVITTEHHNVVLDFIVSLSGDAWPRIPHASSDAAEARWVALGEMPELPLVDGLLEFLRTRRLVP
jgi:ADP-ribose pyrophosphatase YjhB (NUDIX family)